MKSPSPTEKGSLYPEQVTRVIVPADTPTIETERLILRPLQLSHAHDLFEYTSREDVATYLWPKVPHHDLKQTEDLINKKTFQTPDASGAVGRRFAFAITQREDPTKKAIGMVSVNSLTPSSSVGYGTHPDFWRNGYTSEAVTAVVDVWWKLGRRNVLEEQKELDSAMEPERLYAACNKENVGSVKVLLKSGFRIYDEISLEGDTVALFCMNRP